jgi:hypothetical protein
MMLMIYQQKNQQGQYRTDPAVAAHMATPACRNGKFCPGFPASA